MSNDVFSTDPETLRAKAAVFMRLAAEARDPVSEEELSKLARLYLQDARELEDASHTGACGDRS